MSSDAVAAGHAVPGAIAVPITPAQLASVLARSTSNIAADSPQGGISPDVSAPYTPAEIRHAYGIDQLVGDGTGQTIAIVDAYDETAATVASDLAAFDNQFGLSNPNLTVVTPPPPSGQNSPTLNPGWALEISLDVQWAHAVAPKANILLEESVTDYSTDLLNSVTDAVNRGAKVVSMSWGEPEQYALPSDFTTFTNSPGVTFLASTGDSASEVSFPAISPYVTAVGGTSLTLDASSNDVAESAWSSGGGGASATVAEPPFQQPVYASSYRGTPDVAYDADVNTGVIVYYSGGFGGVGGTSVGAPQWAGLIALANQGRASAGEAPLGTGQAYGSNTVLYQLAGTSSNFDPNGDYHDITTGSNGHPATPGYDLATGLGSPVANKLIPDLIGPSSGASLTNVATGGTATASAQNNANGEGAAQAFDGSALTKWLTPSNTGYLQYQFANNTAYAVKEYALTAGADNAINTGRAPRNWTFLGSNDGATWATLDTQTGQSDTVDGDTKTYAIANTTAYKYYRLNVTANNGDPDIQIAELQLLAPPAATPLTNVATGGTATASAQNNANGEGAAQAFDGSPNTKWLTFANTGYLQYQFGGGAAYAVKAYALTAGADNAINTGRPPRDWTFLGSNDGATWTTLDTQTGQSDTVDGDTKTYAIANTAAYKYYRLNVTANNGDPDIQIAELQLLAPPAATPLTNVATGGTATASAQNNANGEGAAQAFDGSPNTKWLTFANTGYLQYQFGGGAAYAVKAYALTAGADNAINTGRPPRDWTFLGSNDGATWATLDTQTGQDDTVDGDTRTYSIANTASYKYYRLNVTANNGDPDIQLAELQLLA